MNIAYAMKSSRPAPTTRARRSRLVIAHVLSSFHVGGAEQVVVDLAGLQRAAGHEVHVVGIATNPDGPRADQLRERGVAVHMVPKRPGFDITLPGRLAAFFARHGVSIVHSHNQLPLIYATAAGRLHRVPVCHTLHGAMLDQGRRAWLRHLTARLVDAHVAVSEKTADFMKKHNEVPLSKLHVILNGIDLTRFGPDSAARGRIRAELGIPEGAWVAGAVGRLSQIKNHALLLRAAAGVLSDDGRLLLVGDGPEAAPLRALAGELGIRDRVVFAGERHDVPELLAALDVFVLSSNSEGLPLSMVEAMATGLPVVSTAVGGIPDLVAEGETGLLVPAGAADALASQLAALKADPARAAAMGRRGRALALGRYSAEHMTASYMDIYDALLSRRTPERGSVLRASALLASFHT
ncbi:glycogen synthase [Sorangium cellulosum]|uniref:Glycogen synthase n=1 Tax=Sorangium cellulosum TaxID=56 RepID=A0A4P2Q4Z1_SORCE|nr:glycosyltransferase [Sorangium cellulosum]AUX24467.1 glycogen synthase [Sorangium cellulosum]